VQVTIIKNKGNDNTTDSTNIKRIREYYEQLYVNKSDNLDKLAKSLDRHNLQKHPQQETEKLRFFFFFCSRVLLCCKDSFKLSIPPTSASQVLRLQTRATMPHSDFKIKSVVKNLPTNNLYQKLPLQSVAFKGLK
jgi:hypothetical protein